MFRPGTLTSEYIKGRRARYFSPLALFLFSVFVMFFAFPGHAGHDYGTIATKGFRKLMVDKGGVPTMVDNPRWKG